MEQTDIFNEPSLPKAIRKFALPAMLGQLTTLIYNIIDTYFVSLTKDANMIAAVTLCAPVLLIIQACGTVIGAGGSSIIARMLGRKDSKDAESIASYCAYTAVIVSLFLMAAGLLLCSPIVNLVGADADNAAFTYDYLKWIFIGAPFLMFSNSQINIFRASGLIKEATAGQIIGAVANIFFDFLFIIVFGWGTMGAAAATSLGYVINAIYYFACMVRAERGGNALLSPSPKKYHPTWKMTGEVVSVGLPGGFLVLLMCISNIVLNNYIGKYGSGSVAAYGIATKINQISILLLVGLANGITPLMGFCYGGGQKIRLKSVIRLSSVYGIVMGLAFTVIFLLFAKPLCGFFLSDAALIDEAAFFLRILCSYGCVVGFTDIVTNYFQALGKPLPSIVLTVLKNIVLLIPALAVMDHLWGLTGVIACQPVVEFVLAALSLVFYLTSIKKMEVEAHE